MNISIVPKNKEEQEAYQKAYEENQIFLEDRRRRLQAVRDKMSKTGKTYKEYLEAAGIDPNDRYLTL